MKKWIKPELEQLEISETKFGGKHTDIYDAVWQDDDGKWHGDYPIVS